ncbi:TraB/GumN family protein [Stenotrophomonas sp.]|uniref:TraB/GumN family protein n=1 Tax=Stenotrophomonas sp. TaxID=69392 RepID=UPI002897C838|nr:TraB/GumN family protein [Stenotrophomonas sp.]
MAMQCTRTIVCGLWMLLAAGPLAAQQGPTPPDGVVDMATVQVTGEQPGPGLWKVTAPQGHVMWILGIVSPLPAGVEWRPDEVERTIAGVDHVLGEPGFKVDPQVGLLKGLTLLPLARRTARDPQGRTLQQVLSAPTYARWLQLKQMYLGTDRSVEKERPLVASGRLYQAFLKRNGLRDGKQVDKALQRLYKVRGLQPEVLKVTLKIDDARATLKELQVTEVDDRACFERTLDTVEFQAPVLRERANAWALGDVAALRRLSGSTMAQTCREVLQDSAFVRRRGWSDLPEQVRQRWLQGVDRALQQHAATFATVPVSLLLGEGYLQALQQRGYVVEAPPE